MAESLTDQLNSIKEQVRRIQMGVNKITGKPQETNDTIPNTRIQTPKRPETKLDQANAIQKIITAAQAEYFQIVNEDARVRKLDYIENLTAIQEWIIPRPVYCPSPITMQHFCALIECWDAYEENNAVQGSSPERSLLQKVLKKITETNADSLPDIFTLEEVEQIMYTLPKIWEFLKDKLEYTSQSGLFKANQDVCKKHIIHWFKTLLPAYTTFWTQNADDTRQSESEIVSKIQSELTFFIGKKIPISTLRRDRQNTLTQINEWHKKTNNSVEIHDVMQGFFAVEFVKLTNAVNAMIPLNYEASQLAKLNATAADMLKLALQSIIHNHHIDQVRMNALTMAVQTLIKVLNTETTESMLQTMGIPPTNKQAMINSLNSIFKYKQSPQYIDFTSFWTQNADNEPIKTVDESLDLVNQCIRESKQLYPAGIPEDSLRYNSFIRVLSRLDRWQSTNTRHNFDIREILEIMFAKDLLIATQLSMSIQEKIEIRDAGAYIEVFLINGSVIPAQERLVRATFNFIATKTESLPDEAFTSRNIPLTNKPRVRLCIDHFLERFNYRRGMSH